jgi:hypothetical protein
VTKPPLGSSPRPDLAVLLVTDSLELSVPVLRAYADQMDGLQLEAVLALVGGGRLAAADVARLGYAVVTLVDGGEGALDVAEARAVRAAHAPWVVMAQNHALPRPGYVNAIVAVAAEGHWTVIGPTFADPEPKRILSRCSLHLAYGQWMSPYRSGSPLEAEPAAHNSAYRRDDLLALGDGLDERLEAGWALVVALRNHGYRTCVAPGACIELFAPRSIPAFVGHCFSIGRRSAGQRRIGWSSLRRAAYAAATPLLPSLMLARLVRRDWRWDRRIRWLELPLTLLGLLARGVGEGVGYLFGPGRQARFKPPGSGRAVDGVQQLSP